MKKVVIGIDLGGTTIKFGIVDVKGKIIKKWSIPTDSNIHMENMMRTIGKSIRSNLIESLQLVAVGIDVPGSVKPDTKQVYDCNNLGWEQNVDIRPILQNILNVPVVVENDANAAALGEKWKGSASSSNFIYITLGTGVGSAIVINDSLVRGINGAAGELGHVMVDPNGFCCSCGNIGCLETVSSATGIIKLFKSKTKMDSSTITAKDIFDKAKNKIPLAVATINESCEYLGVAIANIVNVLNIDEAIIGGGVSNAGEFLRKKIEYYTQKHLFGNNKDTFSLKLATLGNDAGILGIAWLALDKQI